MDSPPPDITAIFREQVKYVPNFEKFILHTKNYVQQYNLIYLTRLRQMKRRLSHVALHKWGINYRILSKIIDIESVDDQSATHERKQYILIGTIYKEMTLRGSVLDEFKENNGISGAVQSLHNIASENDILIMEDESGRISISGAILASMHTLVTGIVIAAKGFVNELGIFEVNDWIYSNSLNNTIDIPSTPSIITTTTTTTRNCLESQHHHMNKDSKYLLFVSGLQIGNIQSATESVNVSELSLQLLIDFIAGRLTGQSTFDIDVASKIVRVIIAGDSVAPIDPNVTKDKHSSYKNQKLSISPSKQLDLLLSQLLCCCPVDIMPGDTDPTNLSLPQQPLHPCLFPHSARFSSFHRVTNPYQAIFDDVLILGTSGQPITDIARQILDHSSSLSSSLPKSSMDMEVVGNDVSESKNKTIAVASDVGGNSINILQDTLQWGHIAPTCPDTLACYPYEEDDPFIINEQCLPKLYFAGNQPLFESRLVNIEIESNDVLLKETNVNHDLTTAAVVVDDSGGSSNIVTSTGQNESKQMPPRYCLTRLISIPSFALTGTVVLVDIKDPSFHTFTMSFR